MNSTSVTMPRSWIGFSMSNSAANEWCAKAGAVHAPRVAVSASFDSGCIKCLSKLPAMPSFGDHCRILDCRVSRSEPIKRRGAWCPRGCVGASTYRARLPSSRLLQTCGRVDRRLDLEPERRPSRPLVPAVDGVHARLWQRREQRRVGDGQLIVAAEAEQDRRVAALRKRVERQPGVAERRRARLRRPRLEAACGGDCALQPVVRRDRARAARRRECRRGTAPAYNSAP